MKRKTDVFEGCSWFNFNNLGLALGTNLKFYTSLSKGLKLKVRKFWGLILTFVEVRGEKLVGWAFLPHPSPRPILNRVNKISLGDTNCDEYDPDTMFLLRFLAWHIKFEKCRELKNKIGEELMPTMWHPKR